MAIINVKYGSSVKSIIIGDNKISICYRDNYILTVDKNNIDTIKLTIMPLIGFGFTNITITTKNRDEIYFNAQYNIIYNFIDNINNLPNFSYEVINTSGTSDEYRREIMLRNIEHYIKYGKKLPLLKVIDIAIPHKIILLPVIIMLIYFIFVFISSF